MTNTILKIVSANKKVNKEFKDINEVNLYIEKHDLYPAYMQDSIVINEITTTIHKIKKQKNEITDDIKNIIIQYIKDNINISKTYINEYMFLQLFYCKFLHKKYYGDITEQHIDLFIDYVITKNIFTIDEINEIKNKILNTSNNYPIFNSDHKMFTLTYEQYYDMLLYCIEHIKNPKFMFMRTNYKPCNAICIDFGIMYIQIRSDLIILNEKNIFGRKVSLMRYEDLNIKNISEIINI